MNRILTWIGLGVAALLVLVAGLTALLYIAVDEQALKEHLVTLVDRELDARLHIDGELVLSVLPTLRIAVNGARLTGPGDADAEIASAQALRLGARLLPLLRGDLSVATLEIEGLRLHGHRDAQGRANWETLVRSQEAPVPASPDQPGADAPPQLGIDRVRIEDGALDYRDEQAGKRYQIQFLSLRADGVDLSGTPFRLDAEGRLVIDGGKQDLQFALGSRIRTDLGTGTLALADTALRLTPSDGPALTLSAPALELAYGARQLHAAEFTLVADSVDANGSIDADWSNPSAHTASGRLGITRLDALALAQALGSTLPGTVNPDALARMTLAADYAYTDNAIELKALRLAAGELSVEGNARYGFGQPASIAAQLQSPSLDLDYLLLPPPADPPSDGDEEESAAAAAAAAPAPAGTNELAELMTLAGSIDVSLGGAQRAGLELQQVRAQLVLQPGTATLSKLEATLYGGSLSGKAHLDARMAGALQASATLTGIELRPLLMATQKMDRIEGRLDGSFDLHASGTTPKAWIATLAGPFGLKIHDPVLRELNVEEVVCKAAATLNQESLSANFEPLTRLQDLHAALDFSAGVGKLRSLEATLPNMSLSGKGRIELPRRRFDVQLDVRVTHDPVALDPACRMTQKMQRVEWPLSCKGSFDESPKQWCGIDQDDLAKIATQLAGDKLKDKLKKKFGDFFKNQ